MSGNGNELVSLTLGESADLINRLNQFMVGERIGDVINAMAYLCACAIVMIQDDPVARLELLDQVTEVMLKTVKRGARPWREEEIP